MHLSPSISRQTPRPPGGPQSRRTTRPVRIRPLTTLIDHILESGDTRITWTLEMENGDVLRIHTDLIVTEISTVHYRPGDAPHGHHGRAVSPGGQDRQGGPWGYDLVYIHLPGVTYEGSLVIGERSINLYGGEEGKTVFTGGIQVTQELGNICYFDGLEIRGSGEGIGISASARVHLTNCKILRLADRPAGLWEHLGQRHGLCVRGRSGRLPLQCGGRHCDAHYLPRQYLPPQRDRRFAGECPGGCRPAVPGLPFFRQRRRHR